MKYDIMHFEALGEESEHLREETEKAQKAGLLPQKYEYVITPLTARILRQRRFADRDQIFVRDGGISQSLRDQHADVRTK